MFEVEFEFIRTVRGCSYEKSIVIMMRNQIGITYLVYDRVKLFKCEGGEVQRLYPNGKSNNKYKSIQVRWLKEKRKVIDEKKLELNVKDYHGNNVNILKDNRNLV